MGKFMTFVDGFKTYGLGALVGLVVALQYNGIIPDGAADTAYKALGVGIVFTVRHAITKSGPV